MNCSELRDKTLDLVRKELLGPGSEDLCENIKYEIITDSPIERYSTGILYPLNNNIDVIHLNMMVKIMYLHQMIHKMN